MIKYKKLNLFGLIFSLLALSVLVVSQLVLYFIGSLGKFLFPLIYSGFILPFLISSQFRELTGCGIKDEGCELSGIVGYMMGVGLLLLIYYIIGYLISLIVKKYVQEKYL